MDLLYALCTGIKWPLIDPVDSYGLNTSHMLMILDIFIYSLSFFTHTYTHLLRNLLNMFVAYILHVRITEHKINLLVISAFFSLSK